MQNKHVKLQESQYSVCDFEKLKNIPIEAHLPYYRKLFKEYVAVRQSISGIKPISC